MAVLPRFHEQLDYPIDGWDGSASECCNRTGVICENSTDIPPRVVGLVLGNRRLGGGVDDSLTESTLCHNASYIETLDLSGNYFHREIPRDIANCSSLQRLFLDGNNLCGILLEGIFQLRHMGELHVQGNRLSWQLDDRINKLVHLVKLDLSYNLFSGKIPDSFSRLVNLEPFSAGSNQFSGPLPSSLASSPSLSLIYLGNNSLSGPISINCTEMINITYLDLHSNIFDGPIPEELSTCHGLIDLNLGLNRHPPNELPANFWNLKALKHLLLANVSLVNLSAALQTLQYCRNLTTLIINWNFWDEEIPQNPDLQFHSLKTLVIPNNRLRGSLPVWLSGCTNLQVLDLSWNQLSGPIPIWIGKLNHLFYLDLSLNNFTGELPERLAKLGNLMDLNFSSMVDPSSSFSVYVRIPERRSLKYNHVWNLPPTLDLSSNKLSGPILAGLGNLRGLHALKLNNNIFLGNIPVTLSGMENLELLDLSQNNLSGQIPLTLIELNFLSHFNVSFNRLSGEVPSGGQFTDALESPLRRE
ncbi:phytosulfokine receptor 1-like [Punica granatum]|uniref:Phytosulfokine receptor 1-like n=1 Tax=Punica granatum TaxID=22663 RepID=A0A6P8C7T9_PUNGR|nr:phytosulfokine receptor 1-like [Punica granatum]